MKIANVFVSFYKTPLNFNSYAWVIQIYSINGLNMLPSKYLVFRKPTTYESLLGK